MRKETINFVDPFTGEKTKDTWHFHLNKADLLRILGQDSEGDWEKYVQKIVQSGDHNRTIDFIESIVHASVGKKTPEGAYVKNKTIADSFIASEAYGELFVKMITEEKYTEQFIADVIGERINNNKPNQQRQNLETLTSKQNRNKRRNNKR